MLKINAYAITVFSRSMDYADAQAMYVCLPCLNGLRLAASDGDIADVWVDNKAEPGAECDVCHRIAGGRIAQLRRAIREERAYRAQAEATRKSLAHHDRYHGDRCIYGTSECELHQHHAEEE